MKSLLAGGLSLLLLSCAGEQHSKVVDAKPLTPHKVQVVSVQSKARASGDEVVGTVRAKSVSAISSSIMGTIKALKVAVGSQVRAGELLVQLSAGEIEAKAAQAQAAFAQAQVEMKRAEQLRASQSIPSAQYDATSAQYKLAQSALQEAEVMRSYLVIRAPFAGVITQKQANVGDLAVPGRPLLVLESPSQLRLEAAVPEGSAHTLHVGDTETVRIDALGKEISAKVSEVSPSADPASRTVLVKLDLPSLPELRAGMFGRLHVSTAEAQALVIPASALIRRGQLESVFVSDGKNARLRLVRTAQAAPPELQVLAGLSEGEHVVVSDVSLLRDGEPLEVQP